jgi:4-amino-4-deoxy-L-arabinose transferase-like glycosyltransferase
MATYASRPAWDVRTWALTRTRLAIPGAFVSLLLISLYVRTREIGIGFWIDEGLSVGISNRPLGQIPHALREDGSPPLYYVLLHFWMALSGHGEAGVRAMSLLFALLAIPVAWWAAAKAFRSARAAWIAALLAALNPFLSQYAQEARMYSLVALLIFPATACFLRAYAMDAATRQERRPWIAGFAVSVAAALYTHNWPIFFAVAAAGAWVGLYRIAPSERRSELIRDGLLGFGGAVVLYLPWLPTTLYQAAHTGAPWSDRPTPSGLSDVGTQLLGRVPQIVLLICAGAGLLALLRPRGEAQRFTERGRVVLTLVVLGVGTVVLAWLASQASPAWANRYLAVALAPWLLLAAGGLAFAGRLGLVGLALVVVMWAQDAAPSEKSNVRPVMQAIDPSLRPGDLVISTQPETLAVLRYYAVDGLRYGTLTGGRTDEGVWDWRDGVDRLQRTTPANDLKPLIDAQPVGSRIVLVTPIFWSLARWKAPWTSLIRIRSQQWEQALSNDPRLRISAIQPQSFEPPAQSPVQATVLVKTRR